MSREYPRYPAYKDSGVEWLGMVPEGWSTMPLKRLATIQNGQDYSIVADPDGEIPVIGSGGEFTRASTPLFTGESVLLGRKGTIDKPLYINGPFWAVDTMFYTLIDDQAYGRFVYYCAINIPFRYYSTNTALPSMTKEDLSSHVVAAPERSEQQQVATFLDQETSRLDALISEQRRLIDLLREKRSALISHAVTKGLDPNVPMKDSGVEWLGLVPEHWDVVPLKWHSRCSSGDGLASEDVELAETNESFIPVVGGNGPMGFTTSANIEQEVLAVGRVGALCGNVHIVSPPAWITDNALVLRPNSDKFDNRYLAHVLRFRNLNDIAAKTAQPLITGTQVRNQLIPRPSFTEQLEIVTFLDLQTSRMDSLISEAERSISFLQERRSALITAAVTGKIDVRGLVEA